MNTITKHYEKNITVNITYVNKPSPEAIAAYAKMIKKILNQLDTKMNAS